MQRFVRPVLQWHCMTSFMKNCTINYCKETGHLRSQDSHLMYT